MSIIQQSGPPVYNQEQLLQEQARSGSQGLTGHSRPDTPANSTNTAVTDGSGHVAVAGDGGFSSTADSGRSTAASPSPSRFLQQHQQILQELQEQQQQVMPAAIDADVA